MTSAPTTENALENWVATLVDLVRRASTRLPDDVLAALRSSKEAAEVPRAGTILSTICQNAELAAQNATPMCQDTGTLTFWVEHPAGVGQRRIAEAIRQAVAAATARGFLSCSKRKRPSAIRKRSILPSKRQTSSRNSPKNCAAIFSFRAKRTSIPPRPRSSTRLAEKRRRK